MSTTLPPSELILNPDGSIYHLHLLPEDVGDYIITVGDQERVSRVSRHFDRILVKKAKREFVTHTGELGGKRISVISTGIGPDNIDIVLNELDALVNIDLSTRTVKTDLRSLPIIRIGTTGGLQPDVPVDEWVFSEAVLGWDNLLHFYAQEPTEREQTLWNAWQRFVTSEQLDLPVSPYLIAGDPSLLDHIASTHYRGITLTAPGFYAPQGRQLRATSRMRASVVDRFPDFRYGDLRLSNLEMETSAIYGLSKVLGHCALSCSVILANRANQTFSTQPTQAVDRLIEYVLEKIVLLPHE